MTASVIEVVTLVTAVLVLATAVVAYRTRKEVRLVHVLVNSRMTEALDRIEQLKTALVDADTPVPDEPNGTPI